jgi:hypothetical protein
LIGRVAPLFVLGLTGCLLFVSEDTRWPCTTDSDCDSGQTCVPLSGNPPACYPRGYCLEDADCAGGLGNKIHCASHACTCQVGGITCGSTCVDTRSDPENCGACGHACATLAGCTNGVCACEPGWLLCSGACADVAEDPSNCGGCGVACPANAQCNAGVCQCFPGEHVCAGACVDEGSDPNNCGGCGVTCTSGVCLASMCR